MNNCIDEAIGRLGIVERFLRERLFDHRDTAFEEDYQLALLVVRDTADALRTEQLRRSLVSRSNAESAHAEFGKRQDDERENWYGPLLRQLTAG